MPAIATPRQRSALMLSDWNLVCLPRTAFSPRDCRAPNDSRGNPAIVPTAILKNDLGSYQRIVAPRPEATMQICFADFDAVPSPLTKFPSGFIPALLGNNVQPNTLLPGW
jgi:hypothetical protein